MAIPKEWLEERVLRCIKELDLKHVSMHSTDFVRITYTLPLDVENPSDSEFTLRSHWWLSTNDVHHYGLTADARHNPSSLYTDDGEFAKNVFNLLHEAYEQPMKEKEEAMRKVDEERLMALLGKYN